MQKQLQTGGSKTAGYDSLDAAKEDGTAFVFMGHGTSHSAKVSYSQMAASDEDLPMIMYLSELLRVNRKRQHVKM